MLGIFKFMNKTISKSSIILRLLSLTVLLSLFSRLYAFEEQRLIIGFGSCAEQHREQPIWNTIAKHKPELFILAGDNIYVKGSGESKFTESYKTLSNNPFFSKFRQSTPLIGIWDDNDYGKSDAGKELKDKENSKSAFIDFFNYPEVNQLKDKDVGLFHSRWLDLNGKKIHIILPDTRWYRDRPLRTYLSLEQAKALNLGPYQPAIDDTTTMLGEEQWSWLEAEFKKPADFKILVSSIQFLNEYSGWETWANFPHERRRLLDLIDQYTDNNFIILSGDIHKAEISELQYKEKLIVEVTSSGLASHIYPKAINKHRIGETFEELNYGMLTIKDTGKENGKLSVVASIYNIKGVEKLSAEVGK
ncbi:MAG: alkaline phosphatase D [Enterobacterales bacterium]|jgi:alkaline phosphatase D